jgi:hypothetical protein
MLNHHPSISRYGRKMCRRRALDAEIHGPVWHRGRKLGPFARRGLAVSRVRMP